MFTLQTLRIRLAKTEEDLSAARQDLQSAQNEIQQLSAQTVDLRGGLSEMARLLKE